MRPFIGVGVIQSTLDYRIAWAGGPTISNLEASKAESEIDSALNSLASGTQPPEIIILPELSVPLSILPKLRHHADRIESVIIAGLDYRRPRRAPPRTVVNEAVLIVPRRWLGRRTLAPNALRRIGKTYPSAAEERDLSKHGFSFRSDPAVWLFDGGEAGQFAVAICYDFLDLERVAIYRSRVHHFFIIAYNKDTGSFDIAAEALARMIFCNVVVCNTGYYGGSLAVCPYREPFRRTIYRSQGPHLFSAQVFQIPVESLNNHQSAPNASTASDYKSLPPGFSKTVDLFPKSASLF